MERQKTNVKNNKGITLIALIITIIILLILAMVSVNLIVNQSIIQHAQEATNKYTVEEEREKINLATLEAKLANNGGNVTKENLENALKNIFGAGKYTFVRGTAPFEVSVVDGTGIVYQISGVGKVTIKDTNEDISGATLEPEDFTYTENGDGTITVTGIKVGQNGITTEEEQIEVEKMGCDQYGFYGVIYKLSSGLKTIYKNGAKVTTMNIPSTIDGKEVTEIGNTTIIFTANESSSEIYGSATIEYADLGLNGYNVETLIIPGTIKTISSIFNEAEQKIETNGFSLNIALKNVILENGVINIDAAAFAFCASLENVKIPDSIINIGEVALVNCFSLDEIKLPNNMETVVDDSAFEGSIINKLIIPDSKANYENRYFCYTKELNVPDKMKIINYNEWPYPLKIQVRGENLIFGHWEDDYYGKDIEITPDNAATLVPNPNITFEWNCE